MKELDLKDLKVPEVFQQLCEELLSAEYRDFRAIDDTTGDGGCDGLAQGDRLWFQFYYPSLENAYEKRMNNIKEKINKDLKKLTKPFPEEWIIVTPYKVSQDVHQYCHKKEDVWSPMRICIWSEPKIKTLLYRHVNINEAWLKKIYGASIEVVPPETLTYAKRDSPSELLEIDSSIGKSLKDWKFGDKLKQVHKYDSTGKAQITLEPIDPKNPVAVSITGRLRFDHTHEGDKKLQEFKDFVDKGTEFAADQKFLESFKVQIDGVSFQDKNSSSKFSELRLKPHLPPPFPAYIDLFKGKSERLQRIGPVEFTLSRRGREEMLFDNFQQKGERLKFEVLIKTNGQRSEFKLEFDNDKADAVDGLRYAGIILDIQRATELRLFINSSPRPIVFLKVSNISKEIEDNYETCKLLQEIQDTIGEIIPSLSGREHDPIEIGLMHSVVTRGRYEQIFETFEMSFIPQSLVNLRRLLDMNCVGFKLSHQAATESILGKEIELGPSVTYITGLLEDKSRAEVSKCIQQNDLKEVRITIVPVSRDLPIVRFFPRWLSHPEEVMNKFETKRFALEKRLIANRELRAKVRREPGEIKE